MAIESGDEIEFEYIGRLDDGTVFDTSRKSVAEANELDEANPDRAYDPYTVTVGASDIIEGLEEALVGMEMGETKTVTVPPEKGYGHRSEEQVVEYETDTFSAMLEEQPREGMVVRTEEGLHGEVSEVDEEQVAVDFNHDLAGKTLEFEIEITAID